MLTEAQVKQLRDILENQRDRLLRNAEQAVAFSKDRDRDRVGRDSIDESVEEWMYGTELRLADRGKFLLDKIGEALARLGGGTADTCEECEEPIGFKRLLARPMATLCILCKEDREHNEP